MEKNDKKLTTSQLKSAYMFAKQKRNIAYNDVRTALSKLTNNMQLLTGKSESELTKKDLFECLNLVFKYIRAYSLYRYYRDSVDVLISKLNNIGD